MAEIFYTNIKNYSLKELNLSLLPKYRQEKTERLVHESDKLRCACAGFLIKKYVGDNIKLNEYGKPFSESGKRFNLSHSGDYVIIALSDYDVGCDVEVTRDADYTRLGKIIFHENEQKTLLETDDKKDYFFRLWTAKEAFIKCIGEGFHFNAGEIDLSLLPEEIKYKGRTLFFKEYMLKDARIMLCTEDKILPKTIKETFI